MLAIKDLIEDWIEIRATLKHQLEMLESDEIRTGLKIPNATTQATLASIEICVREINSLLKEYARADRT